MNVSLVLAVAGEFPTLFVLVYVVGFIAALSLGLIAWYNSKRPVGFERSQRPGYIPKIDTGVDQEPLRFEDYEPFPPSTETADADAQDTPDPVESNGADNESSPPGNNE